MEERGSAQRLVAIDALRGIAALAVLVCHLPFSMRSTGGDFVPAESVVFPDWVAAITDYGRSGVHLFLVLSGFCIHMNWAKRGKTGGKVDFGAFWKRRLHRLYPPYFVTLVLTVAGLYVLHTVVVPPQGGGIAAHFGYASAGQLALDLVLLVFLFQNVNDSSYRIGNGSFWTLALEEQLYMLYFPLLWLRRQGWTRTLLVTGLVTLAWRVGGIAIYGDAPRWWVCVGPARWFEWVLGALAVEAHLGLVKLPRWCHSAAAGVVLLAAALALNSPALKNILVVSPFRDASFGLAFFVWVNVACRLRWENRLGMRVFAFVGLFSYSLYLTHELVMVPTKFVGLRLGIGAAGIAVARMVVPLVGAWVFYRLVEKRFINASRASASRKAPSELPAPRADAA